jgi:hypothetical protein
MAYRFAKDYIQRMCGRVIQSSGPLRYALVDGMNVRDSRTQLPTSLERRAEP